MNKLGKILMVLLVLSASAVLMAASSRSVFSKVKVEVKLENPPIPNTSRTASSNPKVISSHRWLVLKITYTPQQPHEGGPNRNTFLDDVKMSVTALFPAGTSSSDEYGMFTGGQSLWTVFCDGRQHVAMMFVPPQLLRRYVYMLEPYNGVRGIAKNHFKVEVTFTDRGGQELGRGYFGVPGTTEKQAAAFQKMADKIPGNRVVNGAFMVRSDTPWTSMDPSQFDVVKPEGLKLPEAPNPPRDIVVVRRSSRSSLEETPKK